MRVSMTTKLPIPSLISNSLMHILSLFPWRYAVVLGENVYLMNLRRFRVLVCDCKADSARTQLPDVCFLMNWNWMSGAKDPFHTASWRRCPVFVVHNPFSVIQSYIYICTSTASDDAQDEMEWGDSTTLRNRLMLKPGNCIFQFREKIRIRGRKEEKNDRSSKSKCNNK